MKAEKTATFVLCLLLGCCLFLNGCAMALKNDTLDTQMDLVIDALNRDDEEAFLELFYPDYDFGVDLHEIYPQLREVWTPLDRGEIKLVHYNIVNQKTSHEIISEGIYRLPRSDEFNSMVIGYLETEEASGLVTLRMGTYSEGAGESASAVQTVFSVLSAVFVLLTVLDVVIKKPLKYGWYILLAIFWFNFYTNGLSLSVPLGSIIYWCIRRKLLWEKARKTKTPVSFKPLAPDPPAEEPEDRPPDE